MTVKEEAEALALISGRDVGAVYEDLSQFVRDVLTSYGGALTGQALKDEAISRGVGYLGELYTDLVDIDQSYPPKPIPPGKPANPGPPS